jgi:SseB protein N-terminal domain
VSPGQRLIPGTTPAAPDDRGEADPRLAAALATGDDRAVVDALLAARVLVPVVAVPASGEAEMAVPALVRDDGLRGLPVFTSYDALRAWRADARPVPMSGERVVAGAAVEGYDGLVIDVAGPAPRSLTLPSRNER